MHTEDERREHLGWVEVALRTAGPDLVHLQIPTQLHYGPSDRIAFVEVFGVDSDRTRHRQIRADASDILRRLGYTVDLEIGRDVYDVAPVQPASAHDRMRRLQRLHDAFEHVLNKVFSLSSFVTREVANIHFERKKRTSTTLAPPISFLTAVAATFAVPTDAALGQNCPGLSITEVHL